MAYSKQDADDYTFMAIARAFAERSQDLTYKVGCVITRSDDILAYGWNGMPAGMDNSMEYPNIVKHDCGSLYLKMRTRPEVQHAELNALGKLAASTNSSRGSTLYCTLSPCFKCALLIHRSKVTQVVYEEEFKLTDGVDFLRGRGVKVRGLK
jgi:dCMP deaminase